MQKPTVDDFSNEEEFHDAIEIATLRKSKPELYHFEQVVPYKSRVYPNDKFKFLENPEKWKGYDQYYKWVYTKFYEDLPLDCYLG